MLIFLLGRGLAFDYVEHPSFVIWVVFGAVDLSSYFRADKLPICVFRLCSVTSTPPALPFALVVEISLTLVGDSLAIVELLEKGLGTMLPGFLIGLYNKPLVSLRAPWFKDVRVGVATTDDGLSRSLGRRLAGRLLQKVHGSNLNVFFAEPLR